MEPDRPMVMIVEDDCVFRTLVGSALRQAGLFRVYAPEIDDWFEGVRATRPDALLLDLTLHGVDVVPRIPDLIAACPTTMVAALSARPAVQSEAPTLEAGAFVYYEKRDATLRRLSSHLETDLALFRRRLAGERIVVLPASVRRPAVI